jgi:hypothetical protein
LPIYGWVLLYGAQKSDKIDKWLKADNAHSRIRKLEEEQAGKRTPLTTNNIMIVLMAFGLTG